ncbi:hypothetical protein D3C83_198450 [compost metagenome]
MLYPRKRDLSGFDGIGGTGVAFAGDLHVPPQAAARFKAARIMDGNQAFWQREFVKGT